MKKSIMFLICVTLMIVGMQKSYAGCELRLDITNKSTRYGHDMDVKVQKVRFSIDHASDGTPRRYKNELPDLIIQHGETKRVKVKIKGLDGLNCSDFREMAKIWYRCKKGDVLLEAVSDESSQHGSGGGNSVHWKYKIYDDCREKSSNDWGY